MSGMKYQVGDRVKIKSFDWFRNGACIGFSTLMSKYCGEVLTIQSKNNAKSYFMKEDGGQFYWTDDMIECVMNISKLGTAANPVEPKSNANCITRERVDELATKIDKELPAGNQNVWELPDGYQFVDENGNAINATKIVLEKLVVPKFKKGDKIKDKNNSVWYVVQVGNRYFDISHIPNGSGYFVPIEDQDDYELFPDRKLPKTYEECLSVLKIKGYDIVAYVPSWTAYEKALYENVLKLRELIICRDAYWKIAGEEMGLGKPWEPDYTNAAEKKFAIWVDFGEIKLGGAFTTTQMLLSFPTEEMRDAFYENFKEEIENCKELL